MQTFDPYGEKSEAEIQAEAFRRLRALGWTADKYENKSRVGGPDSLFSRLGKDGKVCAIWIEFKRLGKQPTTMQFKRHEDMRAEGWVVGWCDSVENTVHTVEFIYRYAL